MNNNYKQSNTNIIKEKKNILNVKKKDNLSLYFRKTFKNTISAFLLSLITTIVNFICNIPLLRIISKDSYGLVKVHFELAFTLINYIPRETIRRTSQKFCPDKNSLKEEENYYIICQINFLIFLLVIIYSIIIFSCFMYFSNSKEIHENYIHLIIYIICGLIELLIEPIILYMNLHMENKFLPITISSLSRVICNTIFVSLFNMDIWGFTLSRIIGTLVYISYISFLGFFKYKLKIEKFIPKEYKSIIFGKFTKNGINTYLLREIYFEFIKLNLLNFILSKCQNIILSFIIKCSNEIKSDYSFISQNYSLISRFLFEPIIDAFYNLVNKIKYIEKKEDRKNEEESKKIKNNDITFKENISKAIIDKTKVLDINNDNKKEKIIKESNKEINYLITIALLHLFLKVFTFIGILIIPYYLLIGTEFMGLIYGKKWETNNIDKIGDCYSYYIILSSVLDLIKSYGNATNDTYQMKLCNIALIINSFFLILVMYIFSKWDICGLLISNEISLIVLIDINLYIIFCGKVKKKDKKYISIKGSVLLDIKKYIDKSLVSKKTILFTFFLIILGHVIKKKFLFRSGNVTKILGSSIIGLINILFISFFEFKNFMIDLNSIKEYN